MPRPERTLDGDDDSLLRFARDLRALRDSSGRPGYRTLAELTGYSVSTLSEAAGGRSLPTLTVALAYVEACSGDVGEWEQRWHAVAAERAAESAPAAPDEPDDKVIPYVGLAAFEALDAHRFFGREKLVDDLVTRVGRQRFVAVFGASGAGKSSVLRAGLVAAWTAQGKPVVSMRPGGHPVRAYESALAGLAAGEDRLVVVDQFEEIFTLCHDDTQRKRFLERLLADVRGGDGAPRVVIGVRTDFYGHCADDANLAEALQDSQFLVGPMTPDQLRSAITRPAAQAGGSVETPLLAAVIADCTGAPGVLPLLSHALRETWRRRSGSRMTLAGYQAAGGIAHAIAQTAEQTYNELDDRGRQLAKSLFLRLTALGERTGDTKRRVDTDELDLADPDLAAVLLRLTEARLVTADGDHVEITHEALIGCWPRLSEWLAQDRQCLLIHRQLAEAAGQWNSLQRDRGALYRGLRLSAAQELGEGPIELSAVEREFLAASTSEENRQTTVSRRRTNRLRVLACLLSVLVVAAGTLSVIAVHAQNVARSAQQAATSQRNSAQAQALLGAAATLTSTDPVTAGQLSLAAYRMAPSVQARSMVLQSAAALHTFTAPIPGGNFLGLSPDGTIAATFDFDAIDLFALNSTEHSVRQAGKIPVTEANGPEPESATFSPDGRLMMIDYMSAAPGLYDVSVPGHPKLLLTMPNVSTVTYFASDRYMITENTSETLWDLVDPQHPKAISTFGAPPSLRNLTSTFVGSADGRVAAQVFYGPTGDTIEVLDTSKPGPATPAWSVTVPGGAGDPIEISHGVLALATAPGTIYLWRVSNPHGVVGLGTLQVKTAGFQGLAISADGTEVAASVSGGVDAWDLTTQGSPHLFATVAVNSDVLPTESLNFQTDRTLVGLIGNGGFNATHALWIDLPAPSVAASASQGAGISFSPDGAALAVNITSSVNGAGAQLWDVRQISATSLITTLRGSIMHPIKSDDPALFDTGLGAAALFSGRGHLLATGDSSHGRLWDVTDPARPVMLSTLPVSPSLFTSNGHVLVGTDGSLWNVSDPRHPERNGALAPGFVGRGMVTASPDGGLFVTGDSSKIVLYQVSASGAAHPVGQIDYPASQVVFANSGRLLAAESYGGRVAFWNLDNPAKPVLLSTVDGRKGGDVAPAFSANGHYVAIPADEGTTQVLDMRDPTRPVSFAVLSDATPIAFDPNGQAIAVSAGDGELQLRQLDVTAAIKKLCTATPMSRTTWSQYAPALPYQQPCDTKGSTE